MPTTPDPYLQAASEAVGGPSDDTLRELVAAQDAAREVAPDEAQKAYRQAAREQMPFGMALDRLRADPKREGHDWQKLAKDAPTLARVVAEDDGFAAAAQRDVEKLSRLEQLVRGVKNSRGAELAKTAGKALEGATSAPEAVYHRAAQGRRVDQIGSLAWQQVMGDASPEVEKLVAELEKANSAAWNPKLGFVAGMAPAAAEQLAMMTGRLERSADLAIGGLLGGAAAGAAAGSAALGVGAVPGAAAGSLAGLGTGITAGQMREGGAAEGGLAFREFLQVPGVDRNAARVGAVIVAAVNGGLETIPIARLLGRIPGLGRLAKTGLVRDAIRRVLASPTKAAAFTRLSARIVEQGLFEGVTEYAQEWSNILNGEVAVELSQSDANIGRLGSRLGRAAENPANRERATESFVAGAQAGLALGGAGNALSLRADLQEAQAAEQRLAFYRSLGETVQESEIAKVPEAMRAYAQRLREESGGAVEEFSAPAEDLQRLFQEEGLEEADVARLMPTVARGLAEAAKSGDPRAEVVIPFEDFVTHVAPLKGAEALHENLRMGDSLTAAEAKDVVKQAEKLRAEKPKKGAAEDLSPAQRVYNDVFGKLVGAGMADEVAEQDAAIWAAMAESRASRGVAEDAWVYYQKQTLTVQQGEEPAGLEQRDGPQVGKVYSHAQMIESGADGHLPHAIVLRIPVSQIDGREPTPDMEGGYTKGTPITQPVEVEYQEDSGKFILYAGNHRVTQAGLNGDETIIAFVHEPGKQYAKLRAQFATPAQVLEQRAYHGTPHRGIEKFSLQKMGSGEGAQVYGWGLYFAGNKEVGEYYRERLSGGRGMRRALRFGDFVASRPTTGAGTLDPDQQLAAMLYGRVDLGRSVAEVRAELADEAAAAQDPEDRRHYERLLEAYDRMAAHGEPRVEEAGQLYGVDLPEDTDLLDYDKPISDQPPGVLSALRRAGLIGDMDSLIQRTEEINKLAEQMLPLSSKSDDYKRMEREFDALDTEVKALERELGPAQYLTGERLYRNLEKKLGSPRAASEALLEAGIPGMRYLDAGSRGGGDGTANFVIWDENLVDITRTYYQSTDQTETPEFKAWFGDSKVVDAQGKPLVVYHGTNYAGFDTFRGDLADKNALYGPGLYFTESAEVASSYTEKNARTIEEKGERPAVYPVFMSIQNPFDVSKPAKALVPALKRYKAKFPPAQAKRLIDNALREDPSIASAEGLADWVDNTESAYREMERMGVDARDFAEEHWPYLLAKARDNMLAMIRDGELETGEDLIRHIENNVFKRLQSNAANIQEVLRDFGFDGITHIGGNIMGDGSLMHRVWIAFDSQQVKSATGNRGTFDPNNPSILAQEPARGVVRGAIESDTSRSWFRVTLTGKANLSTFLHESAHAFFEMLQRDAEAGHAESAADVAALRAWAGAAEGEPLATEHLEKIARGFEAYLWEGKAPSVELRGVFSRIKAWMRHVYRALSSLNVELSDEVRGVFDRLLATEEAITEAHARLALEAFPGDERAAELHAKALEAAELDLEREALSVWRRAFAADYERVRGDVEAETAADPARNAWEVLAGRERLDGETVPEELQGRKLSKAAIKGMALDREARRRIGPLVGKDHKNGTSDAMIDPGAAAPFFGFDSGVELVQALAALEPRARYVKAETDRRLAEKYPGYDADPAWLEQKALEALHGDPVAKALRLDLEATGRQVGAPPARSVAEAAKLLAQEHVDGLTGLELQPDRYRRAEVKAAREWQQLVAAKKFEEAWAAKRAQIYNHFAWKRAAEARDEFEKTRTYLLRFTDLRTRKKIGLAGQTYLQALDALLDKLELRKVSTKQVGRRASLASYLRQIEAEGEPVLISPELAAETTLKNYRQLTVAEFRALGDAAKNIEHLARMKNRLRLGKEQRDFELTTTELAAHIAARAGADHAVPANAPPNPRAGARLRSWLRTGSANLKKVEFVARALDGGEIAGFAHSLIFQPIAEAETRKAKMLKDVVLKLGEIFDGLTWRDAARMDEEVDFLGVPMRRSEVLAAFLNMGNAGNKARLFGGAKTRGWTWSEDAALVRFDELLTDRDLELAQQIWDTINSLWPEIVALQERVVGVAPEKVEATPVMLPSGRQVAGGYYPVVKDSRASHLGAKIASRKEDVFENQFMLPITAHGFTEARGDDLTSPLLLDLRVIPSHLTEVIHYLTHYEAVRAVDKLTQSKPVRAAIVEALGLETYNEIRPWLQAVAHDGDVAERTAFDAALRHLRFGATFVMYGFKISSAMMQALGLSQTVKEIGLGATAAGAKLFLGHLVQGKPFEIAEAESGALTILSKGYDREVRQIFESHVGSFSRLGKLRHEVGAFSLAFLGLVQRSVNVITWLGARERAFEQGHPDPVAYADAVVRQSQSSGSIKDLAAIQRGPETMKLFTVAYSYFSVLYNQLAMPLERGASSKAKVVEAAARWWWLVTLPVVAEALMRGKAPEDDESWAGWFALQQMLYAARSVPMLSSVTEAAAGGMEPRTAPWLSAVYRSAIAVGNAFDGEKDLSAGDVRALVDVAGMIGHAPTGAANNAWRYLDAFSDGTMEEPVKNLIFRGPREWK